MFLFFSKTYIFYNIFKHIFYDISVFRQSEDVHWYVYAEFKSLRVSVVSCSGYSILTND